MFDIILMELKTSKYYAISVDSTPDISHIDELSFCVRYVYGEKPLERFLRFIPITDHKSEYLSNVVLSFLQTYGIDILDCRGQSYDNANNMSGSYSGLQRRILDVNNLAIFLPCAAHSLCLICKNAASKNRKAVEFFLFLENLYLFFVHSTFRWDKLKSFIEASTEKEFVLKRSSGTRWSAKYKAVDALCSSFSSVSRALVFLQSDECCQTDESKATACGLLKKMYKFETVFFLKFWHRILARIDTVSNMLQRKDLDLSVTVATFNSLSTYLNGFVSEFESFFDETKAWYEEQIQSDDVHGILQEFSRTRAESALIDGDKLRDEIVVPTIKNLVDELKSRSGVYNDLYQTFEFIVNMNDLSSEEILAACQNVGKMYKEDIDSADLFTECEIAKPFFSGEKHTHASMYAKIIRDGVGRGFRNIEILLKMYLCFFITNVSDERSFSKLKYIKNYLRNSLGNEKLNSLSIICIERSVLDLIDFEEIIDQFLARKGRDFINHDRSN